MNEFEAAMGLCLLDDLQLILDKREVVQKIYQKELKNIVQFQDRNLHASQNYSYFPIVLKSENELKTIQADLNAQGIFPRRYFYPSLDTLKYIEPKQYSPVARDISKRILCLPMYADLQPADQYRICEIIQSALKNNLLSHEGTK
jgi:dTDP-4-amino-4,6-dideoxygalactose transaminase